MMEPIGVVIGAIINYTTAGAESTEIIEAIFSAIASGTFIYVASIDILSEEFSHQKDKVWKV